MTKITPSGKADGVMGGMQDQVAHELGAVVMFLSLRPEENRSAQRIFRKKSTIIPGRADEGERGSSWRGGGTEQRVLVREFVLLKPGPLSERSETAAPALII